MPTSSKSNSKSPSAKGKTVKEEKTVDRFVPLPVGIMREKLSFILESKLRPDISFVLGTETFVAHRSILQGESSVFQALFHRMDQRDWTIPEPAVKATPDASQKSKSGSLPKKSKSASDKRPDSKLEKSGGKSDEKKKTGSQGSWVEARVLPERLQDEIKDGNTVVIHDIHPCGFLKLLRSTSSPLPSKNGSFLLLIFRYIYLDDLLFECHEQAIQTIRAANKYLVPLLVKAGISYLQTVLNLDNIWDVISVACEYHAELLKSMCLREIVMHTSEVLASKRFLSVPKDVVELILQQDMLNVHEFELFHRVMAWAEARCDHMCLKVCSSNQRVCLSEPIFSLIRFPTMTVEEFAINIADNDVLTLDERIAIMGYFITGNKLLHKFSYKARTRPDPDQVNQLSAIF
ncbi:BTB (POZ) domain containing 6 [Cichlidogyrus casuarinus]|uniref:BTB (POZ) domain containing 6 n=1 Tax=Cichlidogyrus casuarinus TaxID=1844966 RepID=A0ABD2PP62_9PLAT